MCSKEKKILSRYESNAADDDDEPDSKHKNGGASKEPQYLNRYQKNAAADDDDKPASKVKPRRRSKTQHKAETIQCEARLRKVCPGEGLEGPSCEKCVKANMNEIDRGLRRKCTRYQFQHYCWDSGGSEDISQAGELAVLRVVLLS
jgi:hypothetical protein